MTIRLGNTSHALSIKPSGNEEPKVFVRVVLQIGISGQGVMAAATPLYNSTQFIKQLAITVHSHCPVNFALDKNSSFGYYFVCLDPSNRGSIALRNEESQDVRHGRSTSITQPVARCRSDKRMFMPRTRQGLGMRGHYADKNWRGDNRSGCRRCGLNMVVSAASS
jgi:hypothetical protein